MIKTAVVILNWNGKKFLEKFLPSVIKYSQSPDIEIYIADNGSSDDSVAFLKQNFPDVKLILLEKNFGFSEGYNKALFHIDAKYFCLLNSDVEVTENWTTPVLELMDNDSLIAACAPKLKWFDKKQYFEYAGAAGGFIDKYGFPFCRGRIMNVLEEDKDQYNENTEIFWASGACMFVRADLYKSTGGLDNRFFAHMEEIDLCWRLKNQGYKIMYCAKSTVYHVGGGTLPNNSPRKLFLNFRNNLLLLYKNLPEQTLNSIIFKRKMLDGIAAVKFLLSFSFKEFWAVYKAHMEFYKMKPDYYEIRKSIQEKTIKHNHAEIYRSGIIFSFFLKGIKHFSKLKFPV